MSMVGTAATREGWPRSRILTAVLAVSLVLNVLFVAGAVWGRIEEAPARGLDRRFERIGAQLDLDATQRAAFDRLLAELRGRGDKVQQQVGTALSRGVGRGRKPGGGRGRGVSVVRCGFRQAARIEPRDDEENPRFPRDAVARAARAGLSRWRASGETGGSSAVRPPERLTSSRTAGRRRRQAPAGYSRDRRERDRSTRSRLRPRERPGAARRSPRARRRGRRT